MKKHLHGIRDFLLPMIDFFYPPFRRFINLQTFRYAASGGSNALLGFLVYYISFKLMGDHNLNFGFYAMKPHVAALFFSFCVTFPIGFFMAKYVVFTDSTMRGRVQLVRYFASCLFNLSMNYILLKILVEQIHIYPTIAQVITLVAVITMSYLIQRHFSFKASPAEGFTD